MYSKFFTFSLSAFVALVFTAMSFSQTIPYTDGFEAYTVGGQLACQNPTEWSTWSNLPCDPVEDAFISSNFAFSGTNSAVFVQNNDVIKPLGTQTSGKWDINFMVYIPAGKTGYFNCMSEFFSGTYVWGMSVYFSSLDFGTIYGGSGTGWAFPFLHDAWQSARVVVDLDLDLGQFFIEGVEAHSWQWTLGYNGGGGPLQLDVVDFFGAEATDEMYVDNFMFGQYPFIPVELTSFSASVDVNDVTLNWETATEINNSGFQVERKSNGMYKAIGFVPGFGTTTESRSYNFTDSDVQAGSYAYRLKQVDLDGTFEYSNEIEVEVITPSEFTLEQNYPNPFNPSTQITYQLAQNSNVVLRVYNLLGKEVAVLVDEHKEAGIHTVNFDASSLTSGVYLYKIETAGLIKTKKMMLMK